jgi:hypothetical protein
MVAREDVGGLGVIARPCARILAERSGGSIEVFLDEKDIAIGESIVDSVGADRDRGSLGAAQGDHCGDLNDFDYYVDQLLKRIAKRN